MTYSINWPITVRYAVPFRKLYLPEDCRSFSLGMSRTEIRHKSQLSDGLHGTLRRFLASIFRQPQQHWQYLFPVS